MDARSPSAERALPAEQEPLRARPALPELRALLEAADPSWLRAKPAALGELAAALGGLGAPPLREQDGAEPPGQDAALAAGAERAERVGAVFLLLLQKLEAARSLRSPGESAVLRRVLAHAFIFAVTHSEDRPWSTARTREVAQEVMERLVQIVGCGSVEEFLRGKEGDEDGRFGAVMGILKQELTK